MKKFLNLLCILPILFFMFACGDDTPSKSSIPSDPSRPSLPSIPTISEFKINDLSGITLAQGDVPATKSETLDELNHALSALDNKDFLSGIGILNVAENMFAESVRTYEVVLNETFDYELEDTYGDYTSEGLSDLKGRIWGQIRQEENPYKALLKYNYEIAGVYDSNNDQYAYWYYDPDEYVHAKFNTKAYINLTGDDQKYVMDTSLAYSYAIAYRSDNISAKFIINFGLAVSMTVKNDYSVSYNPNPVFYGTIAVYDCTGKKVNEYNLSEEELNDLTFFKDLL